MCSHSYFHAYSPKEKGVEEQTQSTEGEEEGIVRSKLKDSKEEEEGATAPDSEDLHQSMALTRKGSIEETVRQSPGFCFITRPDLYKFAKVSYNQLHIHK